MAVELPEAQRRLWMRMAVDHLAFSLARAKQPVWYRMQQELALELMLRPSFEAK